MLYQTQDPILREKYIKDSAIDHSECCKNKSKKRDKKKDSENTNAKPNPLLKLSSTIQVE